MTGHIHRRHRAWPAVLLTLTLALSVTACGRTQTNGNAGGSSKPDTQNTQNTQNTQPDDDISSEPAVRNEDDWDPEIVQRQVMREEGSLCGAVYLGYVEAVAKDLDTDREYYRNLFKASGYTGHFDFLLSFPGDHFCSTDIGQELYLIIPAEDAVQVKVETLIFDEQDDYQGRVGETLYDRHSCSPVLVKCNYSDIFPDCRVTVIDSGGRSLVWSPMMSLKDGRLQSQTDNGQTIHDFTVYSNLSDYEDD